ncbi:MAG: 3-hydroxyacyl-CoA dehydrogenase family protein [Candidatus Dormibacteria bacterium]
MTDSLEEVCVIGAGAMGAQIGLVAALAGHRVELVSRSAGRLERALASGAALLERRVAKGKLTPEERDAAFARIHAGTELSQGVERAGIVVESVVEDRQAKCRLFTELGALVSPTTLLTTNSSTLGSSIVAGCIPHPERLLNLHFFNPPLVMSLVEVVRGPHTGEDALQRATTFVRGLGKTPVVLQREAYGFLANRMLFIAMLEAFRIVEAGHVEMAECDHAVSTALGWPLGPFRLADLVGLDVVAAILSEGELQTGESRWAPPAMLTDRVERGDLGQKSGRGFYAYDQAGAG